MFKRDILRAMRFPLLIGLLAALAAPATAFADETIVATAGTRYAADAYAIDQGERLDFRNDDLSGPKHDVVSTANGDVNGRLFASDIIEGGKSAFVEGSQYLTTGSYEFFCSIHPSMKGKLNVSASGTPKPRPGSAPPAPGEPPPAADQTPPEPSLDFGALRAASIKRKRVLTLKVGADEAVSMTVTVKAGKLTLATKKLELDVPQTKTVRLALGKAALKALKRRARIRIVVDVVDAAGNPGTATDSVKLE
jgi:plastocyanin